MRMYCTSRGLHEHVLQARTDGQVLMGGGNYHGSLLDMSHLPVLQEIINDHLSLERTDGHTP
jgi:hypothetical protein